MPVLNKTIIINFKNGEVDQYDTTSYIAKEFKANFENKGLQYVEIGNHALLKNTIASIKIR